MKKPFFQKLSSFFGFLVPICPYELHPHHHSPPPLISIIKPGASVSTELEASWLACKGTSLQGSPSGINLPFGKWHLGSKRNVASSITKKNTILTCSHRSSLFFSVLRPSLAETEAARKEIHVRSMTTVLQALLQERLAGRQLLVFDKQQGSATLGLPAVEEL